MLHILFCILKIIGIILAVILGILLLLVCVVLFVPVCYKVQAEGSGSLDGIRAHGQVLWLLGLIRVIVDFKDRTLEYTIKIAWKKLGGRPKTVREREDKKEDEGQSEDQEPERIETFEKNEESEAFEETIKQSRQKPEEDGRISKETSGVQKEAEADVEEYLEEKQESDEKDYEKDKNKNSSAKKIKGKLAGIKAKITQIPAKFKCTTEKIYGKIKETSEKKDELTTFITTPAHINTLKKGKQEAIKLLRRMAPRKVTADIRYGFEDPSLTGRVLAGLGILYPFLGDQIQITPDFQEQVLEGNIRIEGRIYAVYLVMMAVKLLLSRDVRQTIKDVKKFKL